MLNAKTVNDRKWGKHIDFGASVKFNIDKTPELLPDLIEDIEDALVKEPNFILPCFLEVKDKNKIKNLDLELAEKIRGNENPLDAANKNGVNGLDILAPINCEFQLKYRRKIGSLKNELCLQDFQEFIKEHNIPLKHIMDNIVVAVFSEDGKEDSVNIRCFFDYVNEERFLLYEGKWHQFNQEYLQFLEEQVDQRIKCDFTDEYFRRKELTASRFHLIFNH